MLIPSSRPDARDMEIWEVEERTDALHAQRVDFDRKARAAKMEIARFISEAPGVGYVGVSWGKDSVTVAHLAWQLAQEGGPSLPVIWVRVDGKENPDCPLVRDAFLRDHPGTVYDEIDAGVPEIGLTSSLGFEEAARRYGDRHISGVRAAESAVRKLRTMRWGLSTTKTCAPIAWWSTRDVFAFMFREGLPVHPAYACSMGNAYPREWLRVSALGGRRGQGFGRTEWEERYYPEEMRDIAMARR